MNVMITTLCRKRHAKESCEDLALYARRSPLAFPARQAETPSTLIRLPTSARTIYINVGLICGISKRYRPIMGRPSRNPGEDPVMVNTKKEETQGEALPPLASSCSTNYREPNVGSLGELAQRIYYIQYPHPYVPILWCTGRVQVPSETTLENVTEQME